MARDREASSRRYPRDVREPAVRLVLQGYETNRNRRGVIIRVARKLGIRPETLRTWVRQAERGGLRTEERSRIGFLQRENSEVHRDNDILTAAIAAIRSGSPSSSLSQPRCCPTARSACCSPALGGPPLRVATAAIPLCSRRMIAHALVARPRARTGITTGT